MKKLIEKIKSYFEKTTIVFPTGITEDGALKLRSVKIRKRKMRKFITNLL